MAQNSYSRMPVARSFRLLKISEPTQGEGLEQAQLQCSLDTFSLDEDRPEYIALSYTWGSPCEGPREELYDEEHLETIVVSHNGLPSVEQRIRKNLFDSLLVLRGKGLQAFLWVDALCINQEDLVERASQVQLMGTIYSGCKEVFAWLGPEVEYMDDIHWWYGPFLEYVNAWSFDQAKNESLNTLIPGVGHKYNASLGEHVLLLKDSDMVVTEERTISLCKFFGRTRYFSRLWVFQELCLAPKTRFLIGYNEISWPPTTIANGESAESAEDAHITLYLWLSTNMTQMREIFAQNAHKNRFEWREYFPPLPVTFTVGLGKTARNFMMSDDDQMFGSKPELPESKSWAFLELLLARNSHLIATHPVDKIYGQIGVINECNQTPAGLISINYGISIVELLVAISAKMISTLPYMTCLALKPPAYCPEFVDLPSWAINPIPTIRNFQPGGLSALRDRPYAAFPFRDDQNIAVEFSGNAMQLFGHFCGEILSIIPAFMENRMDPKVTADSGLVTLREPIWVEKCLEYGCEIGPTYSHLGDEPILESIIRTQTLSVKDASSSVIDDLDPQFFWVLVKIVLRKLSGLTQIRDQRRAEVAQVCYKGIKTSLLKLADMGVSIPEVITKLANDVAPKDVEMQAYVKMSPEDNNNMRAFLNNPALLDRQLFRTRNDHIGLSVDHAKPGDQLWVLCRARVPQVLRPLSDGSFLILGEAYVHGGVDGELFEKGIAGPRQKVKIV